jgi:hypothetical protein
MPQAYLIEFDVLAGHQPSTGATLTPDVLEPSGWRSIGAATGGRFTNQTGVAIRAIHLKTNNAGDTFTVTAASAGRLFDTVWVKNDGTEAYFHDGHIPNNDGIPVFGAFWMRVPANTRAEIDNCDQNGVCPFTGQVFERNPPDPAGGAWTKVNSARDGLEEKWLRLFSACPSEYRDIKVYGETADGRQVLFIAGGELHLYEDDTGAVSTLAVQNTAFSTVNRIAHERGAFVLLRNGTVVREVRPPQAKFTRLGMVHAAPDA